MLGCKPNPVNLVGGVVVMVGGATPLMWVVVVTATVGGITEFEGIAKSGPFAAGAETTNNNTQIAYINIFAVREVASFQSVNNRLFSFYTEPALRLLRLILRFFTAT